MKRHSQAGFLLLEVVFASALVAIGLFALIECLNRCVAAARAIQTVTTAQTLLANKCYEFHVERPKDYDDQNGTFDDHPGYTWDRKLEETETETLFKQTITVEWQERSRLVSESVVEYRYLPEKK